MGKTKNYSGSDLSSTFKSFARKEIKRIDNLLTGKGCTDIQINYGFYYFSGFFTSPTGQVYYISCSDTRSGYDKLMYRTAKDYKDYTGGSNQWIDKDKLDNIRLN